MIRLPDFQAKKEGEHLDEEFLSRQPEVGRSGTYVNFREVVGRFDLKPGPYVIIPSTYDAYQPGTFLIRCYSGGQCELK